MRLRWTVVQAHDRPLTREVVVRCPRGTLLTAVLPLLVAQPPAGTRDGRSGRAGSQGPASARVTVAGAEVPEQAVVGMPPLLDGAVLTIGSAPRPHPGTGAAPLLELAVTGGPDAGTVVPLDRPRTSLGRAAGCDVRLSDPRLSRRHCTLALEADGIHVQDDGSTNGTTPTPTPDSSLVRLGEEWRAGAGHLLLRPAARPRPAGVSVEDRGDGTRELRRSPRARVPEHVVELRLPAPARPGRSSTFPLLAVVLPALAAGGLAWWTGSLVYLFLAGVGPLLVIGSWWTGRRDARREGVLGRRAHALACEAVRTEARSAAAALAAARRGTLPDAVELLEACTAVAGPLWERHHGDDDALRVRLGRTPEDLAPDARQPGADLPRRVRVVDHDGRTELVCTGEDLLSVDLREGPLGIVEPGPDPSCARFVLAQLVTLLPPASLTVVPVVGSDAEQRWAWVRLLPHLGGDAAPATDPTSALRDVVRLVETRAARATSAAGRRGPGEPDSEHRPVVVLVDDPAMQVDSADLQRLSGAHLLGVHLLVVAGSAATLPRTCTTVLVPDSLDGVEGRLTRVLDGVSGRAVLDRVGPRWAARVARALAPLRLADSDAPGALPPTVPLADLLDLRPAAIARRWADPHTGLAAPLGVSAQGPVVVDLTTAGPHALVAGTTGAGKSELLRSWLLALTASQPPGRLALLLVDYKGGATFEDLVGLPHCVGLLTDLDGGATSRVLHSLRAEVRRRESLLGAAGARDLDAYQALPAQEPLPRLLVVVDEFRVLADDAPDVLGQFVRLAATGRSLGIHLVLATQRPGGVVSTDIRANAGLRIALRVQDPAESRDVVDRPDAAWLPASAPGRAVVVGADVDAVLQTAWTGGAATGATVSVTEGTGTGTATGETDGIAGADGARAVVDAVLGAARLAGTPHARAPWLPPLPRLVRDLSEVSAGLSPCPPSPQTATVEDGLVLGVADLPWSQSRCALTWDPLRDGPVLVLGGPRSGRSTTLRTITEVARSRGVPVVGVTAGGGTDDHLVDVLSALVDAPPVGAQAGERPGRCRVLLVVDDADELLDAGADPTAADLLARLLRAGHRDGIGLAVAGGRALGSARLAGAARCRLVHRTVDRADAVLAGVAAGSAVLPPVPGRCHAVGFDRVGSQAADDLSVAAGTVVSAPAPEVQVLQAGHAGSAEPAGSAATAPLPRWVPRPLPDRVDVTELPPPGRQALALGVTDGDRPWLLDPGAGDLLVVTGPAGSGRTTTLRTLRAQATRAGLLVSTSVSAAHGGEAGLRGVDLLLVDDVDRSADAEQSALEQWLTSRSGPLADVLAPRAGVVLTGSSSWFADGFRGVPAIARQRGQGVVLSPGRTDVRDVLGVRGAPVQLERRPGRGLLVSRGEVRRIQVAWSEPHQPARGTSSRPLPSVLTRTGGPPS